MSGLTFVSNNATSWPLDGTAGMTVGRGAEGLYEIPVDLVLDQRVGGDGATLASQRRSPRSVLLEIDIDDNVRDQWASLVAALAAGGTLQYDDGTRTRELRNVVLEAPDRSETGMDLFVRSDDVFPVALLALDPWWYGSQVTEVIDLHALAGVGWSPALAWNAQLSWNGGTAIPLLIEGDADVSPLFGFHGVFDELVVSRGASAFRWLPAMAAGEHGTFDSRPGSRGPRRGSTLYSAPVSGLDWGLISEDSRLFDLAPSAATDIFVTAPGTAAGAEMTVAWEPRWLTP